MSDHGITVRTTGEQHNLVTTFPQHPPDRLTVQWRIDHKSFAQLIACMPGHDNETEQRAVGSEIAES